MSCPVPPQDRAEAEANAGAAAPTRIQRLLDLVRWIVTYGQELAATLQQGTDPRRFATIASRFQTTDLAAILARITRGLMLAGALEARLAERQGRGRDVAPSPIRLPSARHSTAGTNPRVRHTNIIDLPLDRLPSAEALAAELRRRPIGAVLVDICRDLCVLPGDLTRGRWDELAQAVIAYGGTMATLLFGCPLHERAKERALRFLAGQPFDEALAWIVPDIAPATRVPPTGPPDAGHPIAA
jgi:hypothetical protein